MFIVLRFVTVFEIVLNIIYKVGRAEKPFGGLSVHLF